MRLEKKGNMKRTVEITSHNYSLYIFTQLSINGVNKAKNFFCAPVFNRPVKGVWLRHATVFASATMQTRSLGFKKII